MKRLLVEIEHLFISIFYLFFLQVQTNDQDNVVCPSGVENAEDTITVGQELTAETESVVDNALRSLNLCPDDDPSVESYSDYASKAANDIFGEHVYHFIIDNNEHSGKMR